MSEELKPCPFCGGEARIVQASGRMLFCVVCDDCDASGGHYFTEEDAATAWNDRAERTCHLVETDHEYEASYRCTECKRVVWADFKGNPKPNYCPNCGAKVVEE